MDTLAMKLGLDISRYVVKYVPIRWKIVLFETLFPFLRGICWHGVVIPEERKHERIRRLRERHGFKTLVETGTHEGNNVEAQRAQFDQVISIELSKKYYEKAVERFKGCGNVRLIQGDSGQVLKELVPTLTHETLFFLDGHYSGGDTARGEKDTPIEEELDAILSAKLRLRHGILIDDMRCFALGFPGYPTCTSLKRKVQKHRPGSKIEIKEDMMWIHLSGGQAS